MPPSALSHNTPSKSNGSSIGTREGGGAELEMCIYKDCDVGERGTMFCKHHERHCQIMRYQIERKQGKEALDSWVNACRDDDFACKQIGFMEKMCPANARLNRKGLISSSNGNKSSAKCSAIHIRSSGFGARSPSMAGIGMTWSSSGKSM